jgi:hypothetical protein
MRRVLVIVGHFQFNRLQAREVFQWLIEPTEAPSAVLFRNASLALILELDALFLAPMLGEVVRTSKLTDL